MSKLIGGLALMFLIIPYRRFDHWRARRFMACFLRFIDVQLRLS
jgi:hypothetical protein